MYIPYEAAGPWEKGKVGRRVRLSRSLAIRHYEVSRAK